MSGLVCKCAAIYLMAVKILFMSPHTAEGKPIVSMLFMLFLPLTLLILPLFILLLLCGVCVRVLPVITRWMFWGRGRMW